MQVRGQAVAGMVIAGMVLTLSACGEPKEVTGYRDDVKHITAKYETRTRQVTDYQRQCQTKWKTVTKSSGIGKNKRTWTERQSYQDCKNVRVGSHPEKYKVKTRSEKYCVELDHVKDGDSYRDDVWFNVDFREYDRALHKAEGVNMGKMRYNHEGC